MTKVISITSKKHRRLTVERLRTFNGLEKLTDEEAKEAIEALEKLSVILFEMYRQHKAKQNGEQNTTSAIRQRKAA